MVRQLIHIITVSLAVLASLLLASCREHGEEPQLPSPEKMILIYAVNHNDLFGHLLLNEQDMLKTMKGYDTDRCKLLLYKYTVDNPGLYEVVSNGSEREFKLVKEYDKSVLSVSAKRIRQVIEDAINLYPDLNKDLIFYGHGSGWVNPNKYSTTRSSNVSVTPKSFGGEYYSDTDTYPASIDIDELANAIPDHVFDILWFDSCCMSSIEVAYQFRNKCDTFVAYPTVGYAYGKHYTKALSKVIEGDPKSAAEELYWYYTQISVNLPMTVAVMDMDKIYDLARAAQNIYALGEECPDVEDMQNYSPYLSAQYYDFDQYMRGYISSNIEEEATASKYQSELQSALDNFVIYKGISKRYFNISAGSLILPENYSGISLHNYQGLNTRREAYYRRLDWYKDVRSVGKK